MERGRPRNFDRQIALRRAMEVFWRKGYAGASLADLTAAMGINPPSLYAAFGSKERLFMEATELYTTTIGTEIWESLEAADSARDAIADFLHATATAYSTPNSPQGCLIALGGLHPDDGTEQICAMLRQRRAENRLALRRRLERGVAEGELPPGTDCAAIASFYATVQDGMSILARDGASYEDLRGVAAGALAAWSALTRTAGAITEV